MTATTAELAQGFMLLSGEPFAPAARLEGYALDGEFVDTGSQAHTNIEDALTELFADSEDVDTVKVHDEAGDVVAVWGRTSALLVI